MVSAGKVARYIIASVQMGGGSITNAKLQKLLYYVQGWHLATYDEPAFDEPLEAWVHGPVQPQVYNTYKTHRWLPLDHKALTLELDKRLLHLIGEVLIAYGDDSIDELEARTHQESPWQQARTGIPASEQSNVVISHESMKRYFKSLAGKQ